MRKLVVPLIAFVLGTGLGWRLATIRPADREVRFSRSPSVAPPKADFAAPLTPQPGAAEARIAELEQELRETRKSLHAYEESYGTLEVTRDPNQMPPRWAR